MLIWQNKSLLKHKSVTRPKLMNRTEYFRRPFWTRNKWARDQGQEAGSTLLYLILSHPHSQRIPTNSDISSHHNSVLPISLVLKHFNKLCVFIFPSLFIMLLNSFTRSIPFPCFYPFWIVSNRTNSLKPFLLFLESEKNVETIISWI